MTPTHPRGHGAGVLKTRIPLYPALFCSGAAALVYESAWGRMLHRVFGVGDLAVATVLAAFFLGLGLGSLLGGRLADRVDRPALAYAALEVGVAIWAILSLWVFPELHGAYASLGAGRGFGTLTLVRLLLCLLVLLPPTVAMGMTLPVLVKAVSEGKADWGSSATSLYFTNTLGAVLGAGATGLYLVPQLGTNRSIVIAAGGSLLAALIVWLAYGMKWGRSESAAGGAPEKEDSGPAEATATEAAEPRPDLERRALMAALFAGIAGFASLAGEVLWTRVLRMIVQGTTQAFAAMLVNFLIGIAFGSLIADWLMREREHGGRRDPVLLFGICQLLLAGLTAFAISFAPHLPRFIVMMHHEAVTIPHTVGVLLAVSAMLLLPLSLVLGASIPLAWHMVEDDGPRAARQAGRVLAVNTFGGLIGSLTAGFFLVPMIGIEKSLLMVVMVHVALAMAAFLTAQRHLNQRLIYFFAALTAGLMILAAQPSLHLAALLDSWYDPHRTVVSGPVDELVEEGAPACERCGFPHRSDVVYLAEGRNTTVTVIKRSADNWRIFNDGRPESGLSPGHPGFGAELTVLGAIPTLFAQEHQRAMAIGFGGGHTTTMLLKGPFERIDVIELEEAVIDGARMMHRHFREEFPLPALPVAEGEERPPTNPRADRVHLTFDDARAQLALAEEGTYDAVVSQPSHPWLAGSSALYTYEFFREVERALNQGGVLVQWVNLFRMDVESLRQVVGTLLSVFDHVHCYIVEDSSFIMVASDSPLRTTDRVVDRIEENPELASVLRSFDLATAVEWIAAQELDTEGSRAFSEGAERIHDDKPILEFRLARLPFYSSLEYQDVDHALLDIPWLSTASIEALPAQIRPDAFLFRAERARNRWRALRRAELAIPNANFNSDGLGMVQGTLAELRGDVAGALELYDNSSNRDAADRVDFLRHAEGLHRPLLALAGSRSMPPVTARPALSSCFAAGDPALCRNALRVSEHLERHDDDDLEQAARAFAEDGCRGLLADLEADEAALEDRHAAWLSTKCAHRAGLDERAAAYRDRWRRASFAYAEEQANLGREANDAGNYGLAMRHLRRALGANPGHAQAAASLAQLLVTADHFDDAEAVLREAWQHVRTLRGVRDPVEDAAASLDIVL